MPFQVRVRQQFAKCSVTVPVLHQQGQAVWLGWFFRVEYQDIRPGDGFDATGYGCPVKLDQGEQVVLVGDRHGGHTEFRHPGDQRLDARGAVDQ